jgi:hypothetical protein
MSTDLTSTASVVAAGTSVGCADITAALVPCRNGEAGTEGTGAAAAAAAAAKRADKAQRRRTEAYARHCLCNVAQCDAVAPCCTV